MKFSRRVAALDSEGKFVRKVDAEMAGKLMLKGAAPHGDRSGKVINTLWLPEKLSRQAALAIIESPRYLPIRPPLRAA